eukprot:m.233423 g.233423  ORF g.233423 m.233423 type:complete len:161 (+) comp40088_c1_seq12:225-707(+)
MEDVRDGLDTLLSETITKTKSERYLRMRETAEVLKSGKIADTAIRVLEAIVLTIESCFPSNSGSLSLGLWREEAQRAFHICRTSQLPLLWQQFFEKEKLVIADSLLAQSLNQKIFDDKMLVIFATMQKERSSNLCQVPTTNKRRRKMPSDMQRATCHFIF